MTLQSIWKTLLVGQCISIYINRSAACNKIQPVNNEEEFVTCKNCKMTTLTSIQTKLVSQMMIKTDQTKVENFTSFNDAIQSFFYSKMSNTYVRTEGR